MSKTPETPKRGRGRPPLSDQQRKRNNVTIRLRDQIKTDLEAAADGNQRSLSEEIEFRLGRSFDAENIVAEALAMAYGSDLEKIMKVMLPAMNSAGRAVMLQRLFDERKPRQLEMDWTHVPAAYEAAVQIAREVLDAAKPPEEMGIDQWLTINPIGATDFRDNSLQRLYDRLQKRRTAAPAADPSKIFEWKKFNLSDGAAAKPKKR